MICQILVPVERPADPYYGLVNCPKDLLVYKRCGLPSGIAAICSGHGTALAAGVRVTITAGKRNFDWIPMG